MPITVYVRGVVTCAASRWIRENGFKIDKRRLLCPGGRKLRFRNMARLASRLVRAGWVRRVADFSWGITVFETHEEAEKALFEVVREVA